MVGGGGGWSQEARPHCTTFGSVAGTCLRLYTEASYEQSLPALPPAPITEADLGRLVLLLKRLDIADMGQCDFLDRPGGCCGEGRAGQPGPVPLLLTAPPLAPPAPEALMQALEDLDYLAALDDDGNLSEVGVVMSELPLAPQLAKALLASCEFDCVHEMLTLAAMLTGEACLAILWPAIGAPFSQ